MEQMHLVIKGHVQGVLFRATAIREAQRLRLVGWVQNLSDGSVELVAQGEQKSLDKLLAWAHQGPPAARVTDVGVTRDRPSGIFKTFEARY